MFRKATTIESLFKFDYQIEREHSPATMNEIEFEQFYNEHSRPLWAYIRRLAGRVEIADDLVQESFLKFLGANLRTDTNKKAYLYRIATNLVYDYFRRYQREAKRQARIASNMSEEIYEPFAPDGELTEVFRELNLQERALLWLAYVEGHQHKEIGEMLGLKSLSVRVLLFRARRKLVNLLEAKNLKVEKL
ncbi:MAG: RNA polymerase sigma factor [Acidobacteriota bacterium]|nr:RNA polymerase sigma factor [Acidobacteriota bacterium]